MNKQEYEQFVNLYKDFESKTEDIAIIGQAHHFVDIDKYNHGIVLDTEREMICFNGEVYQHGDIEDISVEVPAYLLTCTTEEIKEYFVKTIKTDYDKQINSFKEKIEAEKKKKEKYEFEKNILLERNLKDLCGFTIESFERGIKNCDTLIDYYGSTIQSLQQCCENKIKHIQHIHIEE